MYFIYKIFVSPPHNDTFIRRNFSIIKLQYKLRREMFVFISKLYYGYNEATRRLDNHLQYCQYFDRVLRCALEQRSREQRSLQ